MTGAIVPDRVGEEAKRDKELAAEAIVPEIHVKEELATRIHAVRFYIMLSGESHQFFFISAESLLWSAWSQFSQCSATCGNGRKSRGRTCIGDGNCLGSSTDEDKCFIKSCSSRKWNKVYWFSDSFYLSF